MKDKDVMDMFSSGDYDPEKVTRAQLMEYIVSKQMDPNTYVVWDNGTHIIN